MPKREDEHVVSHEHGEGRPLCPFCGSPEISFLEKYGTWQCGKCERILSHVSRGGGSQSIDHYTPKERSKFTLRRDTYRQTETQAKVTWQAVVVVIILFAIVALLLSRC